MLPSVATDGEGSLGSPATSPVGDPRARSAAKVAPATISPYNSYRNTRFFLERNYHEHQHRYSAASNRSGARRRPDDGLPPASPARGGPLPAAQAQRGDRAGEADREG